MIYKSNNWKFKIEIKEKLQNSDMSTESILYICKLLIEQLKVIQTNLSKSNIQEDQLLDIEIILEEVIDNFVFLNQLLSKEIPQEEWDKYDFSESNKVDWFNDYLSQLYDLGDERVVNKMNISEKFLWVG